MKGIHILLFAIVAASFALATGCAKKTPPPPPAYDTTPGYVAPSK